MNNLGIDEDALSDFFSGIHRPYGMVLVTGPTGSGKTRVAMEIISQFINNQNTNTTVVWFTTICLPHA